jgi:hypothetical protein
MNSENIKYSENVENDFASSHVLLSHSPQPPSIKNSISYSFYWEVALLIMLSFSNNLVYYILHNDSPVLIIGIVLSFVIVILLMFNFITDHLHSSNCHTIIFPLVYFLIGLCLVFEDPDIIRVFYHVQGHSYMPSLLSLLLFSTTVNHSATGNLNLLFASFVLGILAFCLLIIADTDRGSAVYHFLSLLLILVATLRKFLIKRKKVAVLRISESPVEQDYNLEFEDLTAKLADTAEYLTEILRKPETLQDLAVKSLGNIRVISMCLQKKHNIYTPQANNITKNMDEQDKIFIQESCFESVFNSKTNIEHKVVKIASEQCYGVTELSGLLKNISKDWNFNSFFFADCCGNIPLQVSGAYAFATYNLSEEFEVPESALTLFLKELEGLYKPNPYHNSTHASDVMCSSLYLMRSSILFDTTSSLDLMATIIAALGHDAGHPARNNRFLILTKDELAIKYNDISVLENMHTSSLFQIIVQTDKNIFINLSPDHYARVRKLIIEMILATDMAKHFELLGQFRGKYKAKESFDPNNSDMKVEILRLLIKAADIGHAAKSVELHEKWCRLVVDEFYSQGDLEKGLGLAVSMYCDRDATDISKSQAGFIRNIVLPLFSSINFVLESELIEKNCIEQLKINENFWIIRRKSLRGASLIVKQEEYVNQLNNLSVLRNTIRKPSLPEKYLS